MNEKTDTTWGNKSQTGVITKEIPKNDEKTIFDKEWVVILHNDTYHNVDEIIKMLMDLFDFDIDKSFKHTKEAHETGKSIIITLPKEEAKEKHNQIALYGSEFNGWMPIQSSIEPVSG